MRTIARFAFIACCWLPAIQAEQAQALTLESVQQPAKTLSLQESSKLSAPAPTEHKPEAEPTATFDLLDQQAPLKAIDDAEHGILGTLDRAASPGTLPTEQSTDTCPKRMTHLRKVLLALRDNDTARVIKFLHKLAAPAPAEQLDAELKALMYETERMVIIKTYFCYQRLFTQLLMKLMQKINHHASFWKLQHARPWGRWLERGGPFNALRKVSQEREIDLALTGLNALSAQNAYYLGMLDRHLACLQHTHHSYDTLVSILCTFIGDEKTYEETVGSDHVPLAQAHKLPHSNRGAKTTSAHHQAALVTLAHKLEGISAYETEMEARIEPLQKPSHLARRWPLYAAGALALGAAHYYGYRNREAIIEWSQSTWTERVATPLGNIWKLIKEQREKATPSIDSSALEAHAKESAATVDRLYRDVAAYARWQEKRNSLMSSVSPAYDDLLRTQAREEVAQLPWPQLEEISNTAWEKYMNDPALAGIKARLVEVIKLITSYNPLHPLTIPPVGAHAQVDLAFPDPSFKSLFLLNLGAKYYPAILQVLCQVATTSNALVTESQMARNLIILTPAVLAAYGMLSATKEVINWARREAIIDTVPLKSIMRNLHQIYNKNSKCIEEKIPYQDYGLLVFWMHRLKEEIVAFPRQDHQMLAEDVRDLESNNYSAEQKREIINRMYQTYDYFR